MACADACYDFSAPLTGGLPYKALQQAAVTTQNHAFCDTATTSASYAW